MRKKITNQPNPRKTQDDLHDAMDFDLRDPMAGLTAADMSGTKLSRRTTLRLMAAAGVLTAAHLLPGTGSALRKAHAATGGTLTCGWAGVFNCSGE